MLEYQILVAEPKLNPTERLLFKVVANLHDAQLSHRFDDPYEPPLPSMWKLLFRPRAALRQMEDDYGAYILKHGFPPPREPLPLVELWRAIDPPTTLDPRQDVPNDLFFDRFLVSQRFIGGNRNSYIVAAPITDEPFRCILQEWSFGYSFCTATPMANCSPPAPDDFVALRVATRPMASRKTSGVPRGRERQMFVPRCYGSWKILRHRGEKPGESTIVEPPAD
jgi:hypothetical protein